MNQSNIIMYTTEDGLTKIEVTFDEDTVWLSLDQMAELFQRDKSTISRHIKNIFTEGELRLEATVAKFATVQTEGNRQVTRDIDYYNLAISEAIVFSFSNCCILAKRSCSFLSCSSYTNRFCSLL